MVAEPLALGDRTSDNEPGKRSRFVALTYAQSRTPIRSLAPASPAMPSNVVRAR